MNQFFLIALPVMALVCAVAIFIAKAQGKRAKTAEKLYEDLYGAFQLIKARAEKLQEALNKSQTIEEAANAEKKELAETPNSDLVSRANNLFS